MLELFGARCAAPGGGTAHQHHQLLFRNTQRAPCLITLNLKPQTPNPKLTLNPKPETLNLNPRDPDGSGQGLLGTPLSLPCVLFRVYGLGFTVQGLGFRV